MILLCHNSLQCSINDCFERNSCFYTLKGRLELCYWPRRAEGNSPIVTFQRAYKNNYFSNIKAVINTFICQKQKSQLMTPPYLHGCFYECIFESRLDLDSSLSKIFLQFLGVGRPCGGIWRRTCAFIWHLTYWVSPSGSQQIIKGLNLELKKKLDLFCMVAECT